MKIIFLLGDYGKSSVERQLAEAARKLLKRDAEVILHDGVSPLPSDTDGVWIFTHEEDGGCPDRLKQFLEGQFPFLEEIPSVASGIGGKEGGMNAVTEIAELFESHNGRYLTGADPLCIPLRGSRLDLEADEKMDLFFLVDSFLKYCGMDDSESRRIGFETVVADYFKLLKRAYAEVPREISLSALLSGEEDDEQATRLRSEIEELTADYELEEEEILPALRKKLQTEW